MFHIGLFGLLTVGLALFAFTAARAHQYPVAVPAAILAVWFADMTRNAFTRNTRKRVVRASRRYNEK